MASLRIDLLGGFDLRLASGTALRLPTRKSRSLLAYLAMAPDRGQPRATLMGLLWSDRAEPQARGSLRQELHALRRGLAGIDPPVLHVGARPSAVEVDLSAWPPAATWLPSSVPRPCTAGICLLA